MTEVKINESIDLGIERVKRPSARKNENGNRNNRQPRTKSPEEVKTQVSKALENVGGKYVRFDNEDHTSGLLVAGVKKDEKYYFAIVNKDRKVEYMGSNEHFSVLRDVPSELYVLDYLYHREAATIMDIASYTFNEQDNVEVFTKIYIHVPVNKPNKKKFNKNKKNNKK